MYRFMTQSTDVAACGLTRVSLTGHPIVHRLAKTGFAVAEAWRLVPTDKAIALATCRLAAEYHRNKFLRHVLAAWRRLAARSPGKRQHVVLRPNAYPKGEVQRTHALLELVREAGLIGRTTVVCRERHWLLAPVSNPAFRLYISGLWLELFGLVVAWHLCRGRNQQLPEPVARVKVVGPDGEDACELDVVVPLSEECWAVVEAKSGGGHVNRALRRLADCWQLAPHHIVLLEPKGQLRWCLSHVATGPRGYIQYVRALLDGRRALEILAQAPVDDTATWADSGSSQQRAVSKGRSVRRTGGSLPAPTGPYASFRLIRPVHKGHRLLPRLAERGLVVTEAWRLVPKNRKALCVTCALAVEYAWSRPLARVLDLWRSGRGERFRVSAYPAEEVRRARELLGRARKAGLIPPGSLVLGPCYWWVKSLCDRASRAYFSGLWLELFALIVAARFCRPYRKEMYEPWAQVAAMAKGAGPPQQLGVVIPLPNQRFAVVRAALGCDVKAAGALERTARCWQLAPHEAILLTAHEHFEQSESYVAMGPRAYIRYLPRLFNGDAKGRGTLDSIQPCGTCATPVAPYS